MFELNCFSLMIHIKNLKLSSPQSSFVMHHCQLDVAEVLLQVGVVVMSFSILRNTFKARPVSNEKEKALEIS